MTPCAPSPSVPTCPRSRRAGYGCLYSLFSCEEYAFDLKQWAKHECLQSPIREHKKFYNKYHNLNFLMLLIIQTVLYLDCKLCILKTTPVHNAIHKRIKLSMLSNSFKRSLSKFAAYRMAAVVTLNGQYNPCMIPRAFTADVFDSIPTHTHCSRRFSSSRQTDAIQELARWTKFLNDNNLLSLDLARQLKFDYVINPSAAPPKLTKHFEACHERLKRVMSTVGDFTCDYIPNDVQTFDQFCEVHPVWGLAAESWVFHRDHPAVAGKVNALHQRAQLSGLCYMHGPDLLQHYLVAMNSLGPVGMIDLSAFIRNSFSTEQLEKHIFEEHGGNSVAILEAILEPGSMLLQGSTGSGDHEADLKGYGPGLVSTFRIFEDFVDNDVFSHTGKPVGKYLGMHCMVLIGFRVDSATGKKIVLLQNWWKKKQFVEMDEEYLKNCKPLISFVETLQFHIPSSFPVQMSVYAETEMDMDDKGDCYLELERVK